MTIPELVSQLRGTFLGSDFDRVERTLAERESRLKAEIEAQKREIESLHAKLEVQRMEKINAEMQLKSIKETPVKKEVNHVLDLGPRVRETVCEHCLELKRKSNELKDAVDELRIKNSKLECEKIGLLDEKKKWDDEKAAIAELRGENRRLLEEKRRAEASVESWKNNYRELRERVFRLESSIVSGKMLVDEGDGHCGENTGDKKTVVPDVHEFTPSKRNEDVDLSLRTAPIVPSKDALCDSVMGRLGMTPVITIVDSDEGESSSRGASQKKETTTSQIKADSKLPISSGAVQPKELPAASSREVGAKINVLEGLDSDTSSCGCSSDDSLDMDSLPLSTLKSKKRMKTEPASLGFNCSPR